MSADLKRSDIEDRIRQLLRPAPSPELRDRVLSIAVVAEQPITWSDRIWFSRAWRCAAVGVAIVVVVLDQVSGSGRPVVFTATPQVAAEAQAIEAAGLEMGMPPDVAASLARRALSKSRPRLESRAAAELLQEFTRESGGD